ncbi:hypothetical protein NQ318_007852 [Aromia moschata]|uniref:Amine oxidase domain-containing protein n=1 Tax=Aromia moschata TaxID=1265417 RepID=A0AAV8YZL0_9CUCU|nr:hypothetical protein NQ318_007852 [Aromia moschata]
MSYCKKGFESMNFLPLPEPNFFWESGDGDFEYYEIVILGAGMAGIGAAAKLIELGYKKFIILEAQDQAGGRIRTITVDGKPLDVGAQWLHGKDNALYEIAVKYNLLSDKTSEEGLGIFVRNDGEVLDEFLVKSIDFQIGKILEECQRFVNDIEFPTSVGDFMRDKYVEYLDSCEDDQETISKKLDLFDWHVRFQVIDNSCHNLGRLSAKYWGSYICLDDTAHYNLKDGYQSLIDVIIDELPKNSIRLNTEVNAIDYSNERWWGDLKGIQFVWKTDTVLEKDEEWMKHMTGFDDVFDHPNVLVGWVGSDGVKQIEDLSENIIGILCTKRLRIFLKNVCHNIPEPTKVLRYNLKYMVYEEFFIFSHALEYLYVGLTFPPRDSEHSSVGIHFKRVNSLFCDYVEFLAPNIRTGKT